MDLSQLNDFSRRFASMLFGAHPDWSQHASMESVDNGARRTLLVQVSPPRPSDFMSPLVVSTDWDEVTVSFDAYHCHFCDGMDGSEAEAFEEAMAFIDDLLAERVLMVSWWNGDDWRGSTSIAAGEPIPPPTMVSDSRRVRVRSWGGSYNMDAAV